MLGGEIGAQLNVHVAGIEGHDELGGFGHEWTPENDLRPA